MELLSMWKCFLINNGIFECSDLGFVHSNMVIVLTTEQLPFLYKRCALKRVKW